MESPDSTDLQNSKWQLLGNSFSNMKYLSLDGENEAYQINLKDNTSSVPKKIP
jgi:hypothetical protein